MKENRPGAIPFVDAEGMDLDAKGRVDAKYSPEIVLDPSSTDLRAKLESELAEYRSRPRPSPYKVRVLEELLQHGRVNTWELSRTMLEEMGEKFEAKRFDNACAVIHAYAEGRDKEVFGGTGLK